MTKERFEVRLESRDAAEVHARMRRLGVSSKADYVRTSSVLARQTPAALTTKWGSWDSASAN